MNKDTVCSSIAGVYFIADELDERANPYDPDMGHVSPLQGLKAL